MAKKQGIDTGVIASLGKQLTNKVESGQLTRGKARQVKNQRTLLAKAFGPEWRVKVYGNKEGARGIGGPFASGQVAADRAQALERAKQKLNVSAPATTLKQNGGTTAPLSKEARENRRVRPNGGTTAP